MDTKVITEETSRVLEEFMARAELKPKEILVIGCSTSEIVGEVIGSAGNIEIAKAIMTPILEITEKYNLYLAIQCCEHLNRALVIERSAMERFHLDEVNVVPRPCAGGTLASHAIEIFEDPAVVEHIKAHGGIDIGQTLIGMHLKHVAVPTRINTKTIGHAIVTCARTRPKLIGGERAEYKR